MMRRMKRIAREYGLKKALLHGGKAPKRRPHEQSCHLKYSLHQGMEVERTNLLAFARSTIRDVIQNTATNQHLVFDKDQTVDIRRDWKPERIQTPVQHVLQVIEHCLCHGLRRDTDTWANTQHNSTSMLRRAKNQVLSTANTFVTPVIHQSPDPWPMLLHLERCMRDSDPLSANVQAMSELRTGLGRCRVWIRQALMQKRLGVYLQHLVDRNCEPNPCRSPTGTESDKTPTDLDAINAPAQATTCSPSHSSFYHPAALLMNDEGIVFAGLLVGLASIDFCFVLKDNLLEFDAELQPLPYHSYMHGSVNNMESIERKVVVSPNEDMDSVVDQKNFLEDLNTKMRQRLDCAELENRARQEQMSQLSHKLASIGLENRALHIALTQLKGQGTSNKESVRVQLQTPQHGTNGISKQNPLLSSNNSLLLLPSVEKQTDETVEAEEHSNVEVDGLVAIVKEKTLHVQSLHDQLTLTKSKVIELERDGGNLKTLLEQKQLLIRQLESKDRGMNNIIGQMRERVQSLSTEKAALERATNELRLQLTALQSINEQQQTQLTEGRDALNSVSSQLDERTLELDRLRPGVVELVNCKERIVQLEAVNSHLQTLCAEQESSLSEMAAVVNSSKLEADSLRESHSALQEAQWTEDSTASNCTQCDVLFSVSRRRHHCRNCGLIFCHTCSAHTMSLPSSAKPVRVCDACHTLLLHRYAAKS